MRSRKDGNTHHVYSGFTVYFTYIHYITYVQNICSYMYVYCMYIHMCRLKVLQ